MSTKKAQDDLQTELAAANVAAQDLLTAHAVSQGYHDDDLKESEQNSPDNKAELNKDDNIEHFEKIREDRLAKAKKDIEKA